jgi:hypothetical protein
MARPATTMLSGCPLLWLLWLLLLLLLLWMQT